MRFSTMSLNIDDCQRAEMKLFDVVRSDLVNVFLLFESSSGIELRIVAFTFSSFRRTFEMKEEIDKKNFSGLFVGENLLNKFRPRKKIE